MMTRTKTRKQVLLILTAVVLAIAINGINYRAGDVEFIDSDATWHTLLTLEAYNETAPTIHKFLPIVSLGGDMR